MMFSFKSKDKLKKEILKELEEEMKKKEQKGKKEEIVDTVSLFESVQPEPKVVENSPEDLKEIQKKFFKLTIVLVVLIVVFIYLFIYSDYIFGNKKVNDKKENEVTETEKTDVEEEKTLSDLDDGVINISNPELMNLYSMFSNSTYDYFIYDSTFLYKNKIVLSSNLNSVQLLALMTKTPEFNQLISESNLTSEAELCYKDGTIVIEKSKLDNIFLKKFNRTSINFTQFNSAYYINNQFVTYFNFKYSNGNYYSYCFNKKLVNAKVITQALADKAVKSGDTITIDLKVVFINDKGIYADPLLKNVIKTSDESVGEMIDYIVKGSTYQAIFKENGSKEYYFYGMQVVN